MDNLELYQEEQRIALQELNKGIETLSIKLQEQIDKYEVVKNVEVTGNVQVNTEKIVDIGNIEDLQYTLLDVKQTIADAIEKNAYKPLKTVSVDNLKDYPKELKINNLNELKEYFVDLQNSILNNQPIVNVEKQDIVFPTDSKKPIAVRLSNGKDFYDAITSAFSGGMNSQGIIDAINNITVSVDTTPPTHKTKIDKSSTTNVIYIGQAAIGTATSSAAWKLTKIDKTVTDNVTITYANSGLFTAVWDDRVGETYE